MSDNDDHEQDALQAKSDEASRPDRPTDSDEATLVQRGKGSHSEYADAPASRADAEGDTEGQQRAPDRPDHVHVEGPTDTSDGEPDADDVAG